MSDQPMSLERGSERVASKDDLARFVRALADDALANHAAWDNATVESFLGALHAWLEDADGYYANRGERIGELSPWRVIADALAAARMYE